MNGSSPGQITVRSDRFQDDGRPMPDDGSVYELRSWLVL